MPINIKMDDRLFRELRAKISAAKDQHVKVGVLESQGGGNTVEDGETTLAELAAIHEFGAPKANIPARSFLRRTFTDTEGRDALSTFLTRIGRQVVTDRLEVREGLEQLGLWAVGQIKRRIKERIPPPLKPSTIAAKLRKGAAGGSTPLIATSQLINSITHEVK